MRQGGNYRTWFVCVCVCVCVLLAYHLHCWSSLSMDGTNGFQIRIWRFSTRRFRWNVSFVSYGMNFLLWKPVRFSAKVVAFIINFRQDSSNQLRLHLPGATTNELSTMVQQSCIAKASTSCSCGLHAHDIEVCANLCKRNVHFIISHSQNNVLQAIAYRLHSIVKLSFWVLLWIFFKKTINVLLHALYCTCEVETRWGHFSAFIFIAFFPGILAHYVFSTWFFFLWCGKRAAAKALMWCQAPFSQYAFTLDSGRILLM